MRKLHTVGLILWRGGLWFTGGYLIYLTVKYIIDLIRSFGVVVTPIFIGISLIVSGFLFVLISVILERIQDARTVQGEEL